MEEKLFTIADMKAAFIAGETFQEDATNFDMDGVDEITQPDFGDWLKKSFGIEV